MLYNDRSKGYSGKGDTMLKIVVPLLALFLMAGCGSKTKPTEAAPEWIYNPGMSGKIGGVGSARTHVQGKSAQRKLAISRALDELANQMGVKVSNVTATAARSGQSGASSSMESYSVQTSGGTTVKAVIKAVWYDPYKDEIYVWMVAE